MSEATHPSPPRPFVEPVETEDLALQGVRTRAMYFIDGCRDLARSVVCLAGMGANGRSFVRQQPLGREWYLHLLNTPTQTPPGEDPLEFSAASVEEYLDREGIQAPVLVGSSFGGAVATVVALRRPERIRGLVLVSAVVSRKLIPLAFPAFTTLFDAPDPLARLFAPVGAQIMGGLALDRDARDEIAREARNFSGLELKRRLLRLIQLDLLPQLPSLKIPVLAIHGSRDWMVPWRRGRKMAHRIPGSRFALIRGAGHLPYLSHPKAFNGALGTFLSGLDQSPG